MSSARSSSLYGGLFGFFTGLLSEGIRYGLGDQRSGWLVLSTVVTMIIIGVVAPQLRTPSASASNRSSDDKESN